MNRIKFLTKCTFLLAILFVKTAKAQINPTPAAERLAGLEKRIALAQNSPLAKLSFRSVGPTQMNGRVVDIEVNPNDPTEFYVAYASGGLFYTNTNGQSLRPIFENEHAFSIGDIAVNWNTKTIWLGSGEVNSSRSSYSGLGMYKSNNNGKTWEYIGLPESHHIGKVLLHPTNNSIAWVAALGHLYSANKERGVFKTEDGGKTWKHTLFVDENTGAVEMDINPNNPNEVYAATWYRERRAWDWKESGKTSAIYKSINGGNSWAAITGPGSGFAQGEKIGRIGIAVSAKNPNVVFAVVDNNNLKPDTAKKKIDSTKFSIDNFKNISKEKFATLDDKKLDSFLIKNGFDTRYRAASVKEMIKTDKVKPTAVYDWLVADDGFQNAGIIGCEVYKSTNAGKTWSKTHTKEITTFNTYGYYFAKISVSAQNENNIVVLGFNCLYSSDGGKTFSVKDKNNTHPDWHSCWINPKRDGHWVAGHDGGCNITYDYGKHWYQITNNAVGQFYAIATDESKPYNIYGGLQDNGTWFGSSKLGDIDDSNPDELEDGPDAYSWRGIGGGDGMQVQVDTRDNKTVYRGFQFGYYGRVSTDGGARPTNIHPMHDLGEAKLRYNWQTPIWLSKHGPDVLYYGSNKFHRSLNKGEKIEALSGDLTNGKKDGKIPFGTLTTIVESPLKFGLIYVGTDDGNIQVTKDGGYTWTNLTKNLPANVPHGLYVSRVMPSQHKEGRVYVTLNGYRQDHFAPYVLLSNDYGQSFTLLGNDLPFEPMNVVKEDPKNEKIIYIGSDNGLYASIDGGQTFIVMSGENFPRVPVHDIAIQQREYELVVGTHGRSAYVLKLADVQKALVKK